MTRKNLCGTLGYWLAAMATFRLAYGAWPPLDGALGQWLASDPKAVWSLVVGVVVGIPGALVGRALADRTGAGRTKGRRFFHDPGQLPGVLPIVAGESIQITYQRGVDGPPRAAELVTETLEKYGAQVVASSANATILIEIRKDSNASFFTLFMMRSRRPCSSRTPADRAI